MKEQLINTICSKLTASLSLEDLRKVKSVLSSVLDNYEVSSKTTDISICVDTIPESVKIYLASRKIEGVKDGTIQNYGRYLKEFFFYVPKAVKEITTNDIRRYLFKVQEDRNLTNSTLDKRRSCLLAYMNWCVDNDYLEKNPAAQIKAIKKTTSDRKALSPLEVEKLRAKCTSLRDRAMVDIFCSTGCRVSEVVGLNRSSIDFATGQVVVHGKGDKDRPVFLSDRSKVSLAAYLESRKDNNEALFVSAYRKNRLTRYDCRTIISEKGKEAGIDRPVFPHLLRHSVATNALRKGMPMSSIQKLLGHSSMSTTLHYAKLDTSTLQTDCFKYVE